MNENLKNITVAVVGAVVGALGTYLAADKVLDGALAASERLGATNEKIDVAVKELKVAEDKLASTHSNLAKIQLELENTQQKVDALSKSDVADLGDKIISINKLSVETADLVKLQSAVDTLELQVLKEVEDRKQASLCGKKISLLTAHLNTKLFYLVDHRVENLTHNYGSAKGDVWVIECK